MIRIFIVGIPLFLILFVVVGIAAGITKALQINIMPVISLMCAIFAIIGIVKYFRCEESEKMTHIILAIISGVFFIFTIGSSLTSGDILSWIWYHI